MLIRFAIAKSSSSSSGADSQVVLDRKSTRVLSAMCCVCVGLWSASAAVAADRFEVIRDSIRAQLVERQVPSVSVAVAQGNRIVWEEGFGWANREQRIRASENTMYSLASISKPITGTALMTLVQAGKIDLDKPINDYLGNAKIRARLGDARDATVRRVANHSSGLPEHYQFFFENEPWSPPSPSETILRYGILLSPPGEKFEYSNLGYGILSEVIARVSGKTFADYMREEVFLKLGMTRSSVGIDPTLSLFQAVRYGIDGLPIPPYKTDHEGASALYTSAHDLARFGMFSLKQHLPDQVPILADAMIEAMQEPTMDEGNGKGYGVGWERSIRAGYDVYAHTGGMPGVATELRIVPSEKLVVVVLCNSEDYDLPSRVSDQIIGVVLAKWKTPKSAPPLPSAEFVPAAELVGVWKGTVSTYEADMPLMLTIQESGDVHVKLGDQWETLLHNPHVTKSGFFRGVMPGSLAITDAVRRPYVLGLNLKLREGKVLNGEITARADIRGVRPTNGLYPSVDGQPPPERIQTDAFLLAQWAELRKQ